MAVLTQAYTHDNSGVTVFDWTPESLQRTNRAFGSEGCASSHTLGRESFSTPP